MVRSVENLSSLDDMSVLRIFYGIKEDDDEYDEEFPTSYDFRNYFESPII